MQEIPTSGTALGAGRKPLISPRLSDAAKMPPDWRFSRLTGLNHLPIYPLHAARRAPSCGRLRFSGIIKVRAEGQLFDIVIRGRGTWAAARSRPVNESLRANQSSISERSRSSAIRQDMNSDVAPDLHGPDEASNSVMSDCEQRRSVSRTAQDHNLRV